MDKKIAIYIRVSTLEQATNKEGSLVSQRQRCEAYLQYKGIQTSWILYQEDGKSGKDTNRPEYQRLIHDINAGLISSVVCTELSRISRSVMDFLQFIELCQAKGVDFVSLREQFDTSTAHGKLMFGIFALLAQFEREQVSERTSANMQARAERGLWNGGQIYGYKPGIEKGSLEPVEHEATTVNLLFDKYLEIGSYCEATNWLNAHGYRTREYTSQNGKLIGGKEWHKNTIVQMLRNVAYVGKKRLADGRVIMGNWTGIVSEEKFQAVQRLFEVNYHARGNTRAKVKYTYMLSGLLRCPHCGVAYESSAGTGRKEVFFYYRHKQKPGCTAQSYIGAKDMDALVTQKLLDLLHDEELIEMVCEEVSRLAKEKEKEVSNQAEAIQNQITTTEQEANSVMQKIGLFGEKEILQFIKPRLAELGKRRMELLATKQDIERRLFAIQKTIVSPEDVRKTLATMKDFSIMDELARKDFLQALIGKVDVFQDRLVILLQEVTQDGSCVTSSGSPKYVSQRTMFDYNVIVA